MSPGFRLFLILVAVSLFAAYTLLHVPVLGAGAPGLP